MNTSAVPVYADRAAGQSFETALALVDEHRRRCTERLRAPADREKFEELGGTVAAMANPYAYALHQEFKDG